MNSLQKRSQKGFTIVELLIVIVIIGILATLVITTYSGIQQKARNTARVDDLKALQSQLEAYYANNSKYPSNTDLGTTSASNVTFVKANLKGLDPETLKDPKASDYALSVGTTAIANQYAYKATDDTGSTCGTTTDCTKYTLTAKPEGSGADIVYTSLN